MRGLILAAGRGTRLGEATSARPKCLVELGGRPLLAWQLEALAGAGLERVGLVAGYRAESLAGWGLPIFANLRWAESNMVVSLLAASPWLEEDDCLVSYADIVYPASTASALIQASGALVIPYNTQWLSLWQARFADPLSDAETFRVDARGRLLEIGGRARSLEEIQGQYMGLLKITPPAWREMLRLLGSLPPEEVDRLDMTALLARLLAAGMEVSTVAVAGGWLEVDNGHDLELYESWLAREGAPREALAWAG